MLDSAPNQDILDEAFCPDLSGDSFCVAGKTIKIKPFKWRYQKQFAKTIAPTLEQIALQLSELNKDQFDKNYLELPNVLAIASKLLQSVDVLEQFILLVALNDEQNLTTDQLADSDLTPEKALTVFMRYLAKNEFIGRHVVDFFTIVLPAMGRDLSAEMSRLKNQLAEDRS